MNWKVPINGKTLNTPLIASEKSDDYIYDHHESALRESHIQMR